MSVRAMSAVWQHSRSVGGDRLLLLAIADYAQDSGGNAFPSIATLQTKTRQSERTVQRSLRRLVALGELIVRENTGPRGCNRYDITIMSGPAPEVAVSDDAAEMDDADPDVSADESEPEMTGVSNWRGVTGDGGGCHLRQGGVSSETQRGVRGDTRSVIDPSVDPNTNTARARDERDPRKAHPLDEPPEPPRLNKTSLDAFDAFYALYPRKDAKMRALEAWRVLQPSAELAAEILAAIRQRIALGWVRDNGVMYLPQAKCFLSERMWEEPYVPKTAPAAPAPPAERYVPSAEETRREREAKEAIPLATPEEEARFRASLRAKLGRAS